MVPSEVEPAKIVGVGWRGEVHYGESYSSQGRRNLLQTVTE